MVGILKLSSSKRLRVLSSTGTMEEITRPFGEAQILIDRLKALRPVSGEEEGEAIIRWGAKASFNIQIDDATGISINLEEGQDPPPEKKTIEFTELERETDEVRVENPDDPEQFVMVARITSITFDGPDGICRRFNLKPPAAG